MIRKNRRQRLSNFLNDCLSNRTVRTSRKPRRSQASQVSGHRSDVRPLESLEDRLLLTFVAPDEILGIFADQGGAGTDGGTFLQVDTTDANNRIAGGVEEVLAHPTDPNILYAASVNGGIWKTTNGTSANPTWVVQTDNLLDSSGNSVNQGLSFGAISFDLTDRVDSTPFQTLVAATALSSSYSTGGDPEGGISGQVYVTFDGGDTWTNPGSAGLEGQNIIGVEMEFDRDTGEYVIVVAASEGSEGNPGGGLFRSVDGGATFTPITTVLNGADFASDGSTNALALVADATVANPADAQSGRLYAATSDTSSGLYRSDDFGDTWTRIDSAGSDIRTVITDGLTNAVELSVHPTTGRLYVGVLHDGQLGGSLTSATGVGGIFYASDADQNAPTWITMDNPWAPVNITTITNWQNTNDQAGPPGVEPPNGVGPVRITAPGHQLLSGDIVLVRNAANNIFANGAVNQRWVVTFIDNNTISLQGRGGLAVDVTGGQIMRIETAVGASTTLTEGDPQGQLHFSLTTDPSNHNVVYFGLSELDVSNEIGGTATHASLWRGDVTQSAVSANAPALINSRTVSSQWESLVGDSTTESPQSGTASSTEPHRGSRSITFDASGNLLESSDGGVFRRTNPLDNTGDWTSLAGNLGNSEFLSIAYDTVSNAIVAGSVDNGTQQALITDDGQPDSFQVALGGTVTPEALIPAFGLRVKEGLAGGNGADVGVGQLANGNSLRYYSHASLGNFTTAEHDAAGNLVATQTRNLQTTDGSTLMAQRETPLAVNALFGDRILFGAENGVYESFNRGDTIDNASLGQAIQATPNSAGSIAYGGRSSNDYGDNPFIIYAGAIDGNIWIRNQSAGIFASSPLSANSILDVEINPGEWTEAFAISNNSVHRININADADPIATSDITTTDVTGNLLSLLPAGSEIFSLEFINGTGQGVEGIVVGTSTGVYATTIRDLNLGRTNWFQFGSGLPDVQIMDMDYDSEDDVLLLGTLGRGSWTLNNASEFFSPKVSLTVDNAQIFEDATAGAQVATVTATLSRPNFDSDVIIELGSSGSATFTEIAGSAFDANNVNGDDYYREINGVAGNTVIIPAGQLTATATFGVALGNRADDTSDDIFDETDELIQVTASIANSPEAEILQTIETATYLGGAGTIVDDAETEFTVDVTDTGLITDLDLAFSIEHPDVSELTAELVSPTGTRITLFTGLTSGANMTATVFDDEAVAPISGGLAPFTGRFQANEQLAAFDGEELAGTWRLVITDGVISNLGDLLTWSLTANRATDPTELPSITIIDDDAAPMIRLVVSPASINENGSDGNGLLTAQLIDPITGLPTVSGQDVTIPITFGGTATYPDNDGIAPDFTDYLPVLNAADGFATETITIVSGDAFGELIIRPVNDPYDEPSPETAIFGLGAIVNGSPSTFAGDNTSVQIDIIDDDDPPTVTLTIDEASITEDPTGTNVSRFSATIDEISEFDVVVFLQLDGTSTAVASDLTITSSYTGTVVAGAIGAILIQAGETSGTLDVTAFNDAFYEASPNEVATLSIHSIESGLAVDGSADGQPQSVTIVDNDPLPVVTIAFAADALTTDIFEGDGVANPNAATVFATLDQPAGHDVVVTIDRSGAVIDTAQDVDYTLNGGPSAGSFPITITILAGELTGNTTANFSLGAFDDDIDEPDQFVDMVITNAVVGLATTATFSSTQNITARIVDNDSLPQVELFVDTDQKQQTIDENPSEIATVTAALTAGSVTSEKDITVTVGVNVASDATRGTGFDYNFIDAASAPIGTPTIDITIPAGSRSATLDLTSLDDALDEFPESIFIDILSISEGNEAPTSVTDPEQQVEIIIIDDDDPVTVSLSADRVGIREIPSEVSVLTATLNTVSQKNVTVNLAINASSTATAILDYSASPSTLVIEIPAGQLTGSLSITALPDALREFDETVIVEIDTVVNALENGQQEVTVTILDKKPEADEVVGIFEEHGGASVISGQTQSADADRRVTGAIEDVLTHPTNADIIYVGSINGGIWKTENATSANPTWVPQTDDLESLSIGAIEFDLDDPTSQSLVAGTGRFSSFGSAGGLQGRVYVTDDGGNTWESPGSAGLEGENISGIARKGDVIVVTSSEGPGGLFRSTDRGATFTPIDSPGNFVSNGSTNFFDLVSDPTTENRLYAAAEDTGIFRSDDFGLTWNRITGIALGLGDNDALSADITNSSNNNLEMAIQPITGRLYLGIVIAGRVGGIYYTSDGDTDFPTWTAMDVPRLPAGAAIPVTGAAGGPIQITAVAHGLATNDNVVVRNVEGNTAANGYWRIVVTGADTFTLVGSASNGTYVANTGEVVPVTSPSPGFKDIDETGSQGRIHFSITAHPTDPNLVYIGGDRQEQPNVIGDGVFGGSVFRGDASIPRDDTGIPSPQWDHATNNPTAFDPDGGTASNSGPHADSRDMAFDANGELIQVDDGGIFRRTSPEDNTGDWFSLAGDLGTVEYHSIAYDTISDLILGGTQDNGTHVQTSPDSNTFRMFNGGDGGDIVVDSISLAGSGQSIRYFSSQFLGGFRRAIVNADGSTASTQGINLTPTTSGIAITPQFYTPIALNNLFPTQIIIGGSNGIFESFNQGDSVDLAGAGIQATGSAAGPLDYGGRSAVNGDNRSVIYAGDGTGRVHVRTESNGAFVASPDFGGAIRDVEMNPSEWMTAFAVNGTSVRMTTDAGATWTNITNNLFGVGSGEIHSIQYIDGGATGVEGIVVGTDRGTFATTLNQTGTNRPVDWFRFGSGLPDVQIRDMAYDAEDDVLILGTLGRGSWCLKDASQFLLPNVVLSTDTLFVNEDGSQVATVTARLSRVNAEDVLIALDSNGTATFTEADGTTAPGTGPDDYVRDTVDPADGSAAGDPVNYIRIPAGELFGFATFTPVDDAIYEDDEVIEVEATIVTDAGDLPEAQLYLRNAAFTETLTYADSPNTVIADVSTESFTINVSDIGIVNDITLNLGFLNDETFDLTAVLTGPDGTTVTLFDQDGPTFADSILDAFDGRPSAGDWILTLTDNALIGVATLSDWSITIDRTVESTTLPSITIIDDEEAPLVLLSTDELTLNEDGTDPFVATLNVRLVDSMGNTVITERPVTVNLTVDALSTATGGDDYTLAATTLVIDGQPGAGVSSATTTLTAEDDLIFEFTENVIIDINTVTDGVEDGDQQVIVEIVDNEVTPSIRIVTDVDTINEAGAAPVQAVVTIELFDPITGSLVEAERPITADLLINGAGTATLTDDYTLDAVSLTIAADAFTALSSASTTITAVDDPHYELPETVIVDLANVVGANVDGNDADTDADGAQQIIVTITDDEAVPSIRLVTDVTSINEDQSAPFEAVLTLELFDPITGNLVLAERPVDATLAIDAASTATELSDYTLADIALQISGTPGSGLATVSTTLTALPDAIYELSEDVIVNIATVSNANIDGADADALADGAQSVTVTIVDDEATPSIRLLVDQLAINEDGSAPGVATVTAELFDPLTGNTVLAERPVTVDLLTSGTATSGNDYVLALSSLLIDGSFTSAVSSTATTITASQDDFYELPETVIVDLDNADQANIGTPSQITVTIQDDEATPSIRLLVDETTINEDGSAPGAATLTAELFDPSTGNTVFAERPVTVDLLTSGTATDGNDYALALTTLLLNGTFGAAVSSTTTTVTASQDDFYELPETVIVDLDNADQANIGTPSQITVTIQDDEAIPSIRLLVDETTINEDGSAPGTATLTAELFDPSTGNTVFAERPVTVDLLTSGTATSGNDYNLALSSLLIGGSFGAAVASATTTVAAQQDAFYELPETVILDLDNADQAVIGAANQVTITITDDEAVPSIRLITDELFIDEDGSGTSVATVSIELFDPITGDLVFAERPVNATIAVDLASTATNGSDYDLASTALSINGTFGAGINSASTTITARQDAIYELPETVIVAITGVSDAVVDGADADTDSDGPQQVIVTIVDDEAAPEVQLFQITSAVDSTLVSNTNRFEFAGQGSTVVATLVDAITGLPVQSERPIVVDLEVDPASTATPNADFVLLSSQIIINGSEGSPATQATTRLQVLDDLIFEFDEEAIIRISNADFAGIGTPSSVTMTIVDGEATPSVRLLVDHSTIDESTAPTVATVTAELFNPATGAVVQAERPVVVDLSIAASSLATEGNDYVIASKTLTIAGLPGITASADSTTITAIDDAIYELSETINVDIQSVADGVEAGIQRVVVTITDNEVTPSVRLVANPLSINEDGSAPGSADVTAEVFDPLTGDLVVAERPIFVTLAVDPASTADEGDDYTLDSRSLTIDGQANAGLSTATTTITAIDDITFELDETVIVAIESAVNANIDGADADTDPDGIQQVIVTIVEDDIAPTITLDLSSATTLEDGGITVVTATLSHPVQAGAIVDIAVSGTATSGTDYLISSLSIVVAANELSGSVNISATQDTLDEPDETIIVDVIGATNATEGTEQQQTLTIIDDDDPVNVLLTIDQTEIAEGGGTAIITATLTDPNTAVVAPSGFEVTVNLVLTGTATTGLDYTLPTTITIPIGATSASITLEGLVDNLDEVDETVIASIDSIDNGVQLNPQQVTATLIDADVLPEITLEAIPTVIAETGGSATFTLTLNAVSGKEVVVDLNLGGSATGGGIDYDNPPLQVTIPIGETVATFDIAAVADLLNEIDETIVVSISSLTNAVAGAAQQQTVTITDDDAVPTVSLGIDETSILEDAGSALLTATLSAVSGRDIIVDLGFSGTADRTDDYIVPAQILIPAGQISATAQLNAIRDLKDEFDEQAVIEVANVTNATEDGVQSVNLTIVDSDVEPTVSLSASADNVREDAGTVTFFATLDTVSGKDITVNLELLGEAIAGVDYTAEPVTVQIPAGQLQASVVLNLIEDGIDEFDELATIQFVSVVNAVENIVQQASTLIEDTDAAPLVSIAAGALDLIEQNEDSSIITVSLSEASAKPVTVALNFGGTATAIQDYTGRVGSVLIPEGETSATFVLTATDDDLDEADEIIEVTIASIVNADENGTQLATVTIVDDEDLPEISIVASAMGILEDSETGTFTLQLSEPAGRNIDVALLIGGDAIADNDYTALPTIVTIPAGTTSFPIALNPIADALAENDEDVTVTIDATNTPLATPVAGSDVATIAILNDEALPIVSISSNVSTIGEGGGDAILTLTLSEASGRDVTIDLETTGLATEGVDYAALLDQVTIPAGTLSLDLLLTSTDDAIDEFDEDAVITISSVSFADIGTASATVTIIDNDPDPIVSMSVGDLSIAEDGGVSTITVSLNVASEKPVTVNIAPTGTAASDVDYVAVAASVTIPAGEISVTFDVAAINDNEVESQETVILAVASVDNAVFDGNTATVSIVDDDVPTLFVSLADAAVNEADGAAATMVTVTRNASLSVPMIVTLTSSDTGEATVPMTLSFEAGSTSITVPVTAVNDFILDGTQTVTFTAAAAGFINGTADLDVEDATTSVNLSVDIVDGTEADQTVVTITATTDKPVIGSQTLDLVVNGTNITASDYILAASTLTFDDGATSATTTFTIQDDSLVEAMLETATISIASSTAGLASGPTDSVEVEITDNDQATLAISDVTVTEGDSGTLNAVLNVTLSGNVDAGFTVDYSTLADTATAADSDYSAATGQLNFAGTDAEVQTISIAINGDEKVELDEAFFVNLANVVANTRNVVINDDRGTVTITNDDSASVTIADTSIEESDSGTQILTFTATLDQIVDVPVTLDWTTGDITALVSDADYLSASGQVTFTPSTTVGQQATFSIAVVGDEKVELDETLQAVLSNLTASGRDVTIADSTAIATIINDDQAAFTIDDVTVVEGDAGVQTMTFTITLDQDVDTAIELDVDTRNVTATFNEDYQPNTGSILAFTGVKGETKTFDVIAFGDTKVEQDETFQVLLSNIAAAGRNVVINDGTGEGTILNDDSAEISVTGGTVTEGDSGTTNITFTITLDQTVASPISIDFATTANSASATDNDYEARSGTLNFAANVAGSQSQTVTVIVNGDTKVELDEIFTLDLSNPQFAGLNITNPLSQAVGRILNDDSATISIADFTLDEGDDSATLFGFEVSIDAEIDTDITLLLNTQDGTATVVDADYVGQTDTTVTLLANTGGPQTAVVNVDVTGDEVVERTETFFANLSGLNTSGRAVTIADDSATGTITNDDSATVSVDNVTVMEGNTGITEVSFTITLDAEVDNAVTVNYATEDQSATIADGDYTGGVAGTLTFAADAGGAQSQTVTVGITGDEKVELNETFLLNLSTLLSGERLVSIGNGTGAATIANDDSAAITVTTVSQNEGNDGPNNFTFEATLTSEIDTPITFRFDAIDGTATIADGDFAVSGGTVTFAANAGAGAQTVAFNVSVDGDVRVENDETFDVALSNFQNLGRSVSLDTTLLTATVINDDSAEITVSDATIVEGTNGTAQLVFDVTLDAEVENDVSISYRTGNSGTAVGGSDYTPVNGTLTFPGGQGTGAQTLTVSVPVTSDSIVELDETLVLELSNLLTTDANVSVANDSAVGTIINDDVATISVASASAVEGTATGDQIVFTFTLDRSVDNGISFNYGFLTGAINEAGVASLSDFTVPATTFLSFTGAAGEQRQVIVPITADNIVEQNETFEVTISDIISGGRNVVASDTNGIGTIVNDDSAVVTVQDIDVLEGDAGTTQAVFTLGVSQPVQNATTVNYATADGTASSTAGDYESTTGTATLSSGSATVTVTINPDTVVEGDETFFLNLSGLATAGQSVTLPDTQAVGTIINDDLVNLTISDATVREGFGATQATLDFVVTRDNASVPVVFEVTTSNGTASSGDYTGAVRRITLPANGELVSTVSINVTGDHLQEADETVIATLTSSTPGANIVNPTATGTIVNDDGTLSGLKFHDVNDNGQRDAGEPGLQGWTIQVLDDDGNVLTSTVTGSDGTYSTGVNEGTWNVQEVVQSGWRQSFPGATNALAFQLDQDLDIRFTGNGFFNWGGLNEKWFFTNEGWHFLTPAGNFFKWDNSPRTNLTGDFVAALGQRYHEVPSLLFDAQPTVDRPITIVAGEETADIDFGNVPTGRIEGRKFHDIDADGVRDANEPYLNGWSVFLTDSTGQVVGTAVTSDLDLNGDGSIDPITERGWYRFDNLLEDTYIVSEEDRTGWSQNGADGAFAALAFDLDQQLDFGQPANDFFNWGGLNERWVFSTTAGWHFITPEGQLFRWNNSPRNNLSGIPVATLDSTYWQDLSLLYNAQQPNRYQIQVEGQQVSDINFGNTFGHDGTGNGNVAVAFVGSRLQITGDSGNNTIVVFTDEALNRTIITTVGSTLNGSTAPFVIDSTTLSGPIDVQLGNGSDQFALLDSNLSSALSIDSGIGNDRISLSQITSTAPVSLTNPSGTDQTRILRSDLTGVTLSGSGSAAILDSTLSGNLTSTSAGQSRLAVARSTVAGTANVTGSALSDRFLMFQADINRLNVSGAGGNDVLALIESSFNTALVVNLDAGNDSFALKSGNTFGSGSSLDGAANTDRIATDGSSAAIPTSNVETNENSQLDSLIDIALSSFDDLLLDL